MKRLIRSAIPVLLIATGLLWSSALAADSSEAGLVAREGEWVFEIQVRMPGQSEPTLQRYKSCVTSEEPITASETLMPWAESQGCDIRGTKAVENKLTWKLRCKRDGQKSRGRGEFTVDGDRGEGEAKISFEAAGRRMSIVTKWDAKRVGACSDAGAPDQETEVEP